MNLELPVVQTGFRKGRGTRDQIVNIHWIIQEEKIGKKKTKTASAEIKPYGVSQHPVIVLRIEMALFSLS